MPAFPARSTLYTSIARGKGGPAAADNAHMQINIQLFAVALAGVLLTLYLMRRRTRLGKRTPKF
jgi:hypothetical protein